MSAWVRDWLFERGCQGCQPVEYVWERSQQIMGKKGEDVQANLNTMKEYEVFEIK